MDQTNDLKITLPPSRSNDQNDYKNFVRPLTSQLLEAMNLSKTYLHGEGDYLFYQKDQKIQKGLSHPSK